MKKSLAETHPELAVQWHPTKNGSLTADDVAAGSSQVVWWVCPNDPTHEWPTRVHYRKQGRGCPICSGKRKGSHYATLATDFPDIAAEWHPTKNGNLTPSDVRQASNKKVWWQCSKDSSHIWEMEIRYRTAKNGACPYCNRRLPTKINSLGGQYPELAKQWHPTKNENLTPFDVFPGTNRSVWWLCTSNPEHEWQARISDRIRTSGECKFCIREKVQKLSNLAELDPELAKEWHPTKNGNLTPQDVTAGSERKVWWICRTNPEHVWDASINNRARKRQGCPFCSKLIAGENSLAALYPEIAVEWHPSKNQNLSPENVTPGSARQVWWQCRKNPSHEWQARIFARVKNQSQCPSCSKEERKTFATVFPDVAKEWHPTKNEDLTPEDASYGSQRKVWWQCSKNPEHVWQATIQNRGINKSGCPFCYQERASQELTDYLIDSVKSNTEFYKNFVNGLENINSLAGITLEDHNAKQTFFRMLYAHTITLMETYLSDAFTNLVLSDPQLVRKLVETTPYFSNQKFAVSDLYIWLEKVDKEVTSYLQNNVIYHNIWVIKNMYKCVLGVDFSDDLVAVQKAVMTRHDIIHRNGKTINGLPIEFSVEDIRNVTHIIDEFIFRVESQVEQLMKSRTN